MKAREKIVFRLKQVVIMNEGFKSERNKYKILGYDEQVEKMNRLIEYSSIEEEVLKELLKSLYCNIKLFKELEEKLYTARKESEEYYYYQLKKELNIH